MGFAPVKHVNEGLLEIIDGRHTKEYPRSAEIVEFGFYYKDVSRYLDYFDREQMLIILYDDIKTNSLESLKKVFSFLGIDEEYIPRSLNTRPQASVYSIPRLKLLTLRNPIIHAYSSDGMRLDYKQDLRLLRFMIAGAIVFIDRIFLSRVFGNTKPNLSRDLRRALSAIYEEDTSKLQGLLGLKLAHWKVFNATG